MARKNNNNIQQERDRAVEARFVEVTIDEVRGDSGKLIKRFMKKVRKEEVLKPYYGRLMFHQTKSQKRRQKKMKAVFMEKKRQFDEEE